MTTKKRIEYSTEDLGKLEDGINSFAESWPEKPQSIKGKKPSVKVSIIKCSNAIRTLLDRGYTSADIADGLKTIGIEISPITLKSYISDIVKTDKLNKTIVADKKTKSVKKSDSVPPSSDDSKTKPDTSIPKSVDTAVKTTSPKLTKGAKASSDKDF